MLKREQHSHQINSSHPFGQFNLYTCVDVVACKKTVMLIPGYYFFLIPFVRTAVNRGDISPVANRFIEIYFL